MKTTFWSKLPKILLKGFMCYSVLPPFVVFYEPWLKMMRIEHFSFLQRMGLFALYFGINLVLLYIIFRSLRFVDLYQSGEFFSTTSSPLVLSTIKMTQLYLFLVIAATILLQYCASGPMTVFGITGPEFGVRTIAMNLLGVLAWYMILKGLGAWYSRTCRAREEANLTI